MTWHRPLLRRHLRGVRALPHVCMALSQFGRRRLFAVVVAEELLHLLVVAVPDARLPRADARRQRLGPARVPHMSHAKSLARECYTSKAQLAGAAGGSLRVHEQRVCCMPRFLCSQFMGMLITVHESVDVA